MIRLLIADDHEMILRGLEDGFRGYEDIEVVGAVADGRDVVVKCREEGADVVLLDYRRPGANGDAVTEELLGENPSVKGVMVSSFEWEEDIWRSVIAGAVGYIPKASRFSEVVRGVREVAAGRRFFPEEILRKIQARERREALTPREQEVLEMLARGLDNKGIAAELHVSETTVKTHVARVLAKVDANDRTHAVVKAVQRGMVHLGD